MDVSAAGSVLDDALRERVWPGAAAAVGVGARVRWAGVHGAGIQADTVFDLASLTKVLATTPSVLLLAQRGLLDLDGPVPELDPRITVRHLLTHTSGLPAHFRPPVSSPAELAAAARSVPLEGEPGAAVRYSDIGFVLLGALVESVTGEELAAFVEREVLVGSRASFTAREPCAPTEVVDGVPVCGRVHDENAAAAGGAVGHAGLFGSLADVVAALAMWRPGGPVLDDAMRAEAVRDQGQGRGLGWTCRGDAHDILSPGWGDAAVSHTGFTGTSVALDPRSERWAVLLTNAVHYGRNRPEPLAARRRFHAALVGD